MTGDAELVRELTGVSVQRSRMVRGVPAPGGGSAEERRQRLQRLDDCLQLLEAAHERGLTRVNDRIVEAVGVRVPSVEVGMLISTAIDEVFRLQEPLMAPAPQPLEERVERRVQRRRRPVDLNLILGQRG